MRLFQEAYFLIEPKDDLRRRLAGLVEYGMLNRDDADVLKETVLLSYHDQDDVLPQQGEGGEQSSALPQKEALNDPTLIESKVKLLYLAKIRQFKPWCNDAEAVALLGSALLSTAVFDSCWTVRRLSVDHVERLNPVLKGMSDQVDCADDDRLHQWLTAI